MPESYVVVTRWAMNNKDNPATGKPFTAEECEEIMALREPYRMKPHGKIDAEGFSRFSYPDPRKYMAFDPVTGKPTKDVPTGTTTIGLDDEVIRHLQKHPWMSPEWETAYGQRNQVESSNSTLKSTGAGNLRNPDSRSARGYAYTFLCATIGVAAENIRRIITGITKLTLGKTKRSKVPRARRRRNSLGERLEQQTKTLAKKKNRKQKSGPPPTDE